MAEGSGSRLVSRCPDGVHDGRRLRVLVVDRHEVVQCGMRLILGRRPWVERCLTAGTGRDAAALARRYQPHVAVVDLFLGLESGLDICERLRAIVPSLRVLLVCDAGSISPAAARAAGAAGLLAKDEPADRIAEAVGRVGVGERVFPRFERQNALLSDRERDVLALMAAGATNPEIGLALHLSRHTVKEHASSLYRRLGARNRVEAVRQAQRLGLVSYQERPGAPLLWRCPATVTIPERSNAAASTSARA
jgi:DNA-binding NarL/FixJ family response regulator